MTDPIVAFFLLFVLAISILFGVYLFFSEKYKTYRYLKNRSRKDVPNTVYIVNKFRKNAKNYLPDYRCGCLKLIHEINTKNGGKPHIIVEVLDFDYEDKEEYMLMEQQVKWGMELYLLILSDPRYSKVKLRTHYLYGCLEVIYNKKKMLIDTQDKFDKIKNNLFNFEQYTTVETVICKHKINE